MSGIPRTVANKEYEKPWKDGGEKRKEEGERERERGREGGREGGRERERIAERSDNCTELVWFISFCKLVYLV